MAFVEGNTDKKPVLTLAPILANNGDDIVLLFIHKSVN
jgi:hypothetical protein